MGLIVLALLSIGGLFGGQNIDSNLQEIREYVEVNNIKAEDFESEVDKYVKTNNITEEQKEEYLARVQDFEPTADITRLVVRDSNTIKVTYNLADDSGVLLNDKTYKPEIRLYKGDTLVDSKVAKVGEERHTEFTGLDRNTEYKVVVSGPYDLLGYGTPYNDEPYTLAQGSITTDKVEPTAKIHLTTDTNPTEELFNSIEVHYDLIDEDNTLMIDEENKIMPKVVIYKVGEEDAIKGYEAVVGENQIQTFTKLEPDTEYRVVVKGKYDLNGDGKQDNGAPFTLAEQTFKTSATKVEPTGLIHTQTDENPTIVGEDNIEVHFDLNDREQALINEGSIRPKLVVYKGDDIEYVGSVQVGENEVEPVNELENNTTYKVDLTGQYDIDADGKVDNEKPYILDSKEFTTGSKVDPVLPEGYIGISTCKDLESIGQGLNYPGATHTEAWSLDEDYVLIQNIDCSATNPENSKHDTSLDTTYGSDGFESIGQGLEFKGIIDGQGYTMNGLYMNTNQSYLGLIGRLSDGIVKDINISDIYVKGNVYIGGVVGQNLGGVVDNVHVTGEVAATTDEVLNNGILNWAGGVVGWSRGGSISNTSFKGNISGNISLGGIVGYNESDVLDSNFEGNIAGDTTLGGIVGDNIGTVTNSKSNVSIQGASDLGGIVGSNSGTIANCFANVDIEAIGERGKNAGGIVGYNEDYVNHTAEVTNTYSTGEIKATGIGSNEGGIVGYNRNNVNNSYSTVNIKGRYSLGGIVGINSGSIDRTFSAGNIEGEIEGAHVGGIYGNSFNEDIINSYRCENQVVIGEDNTVGEIVTAVELNDSNWYVNTLGFDSNWNIEPVSEGYYPHLMKADLSSEVEGQENLVLPTI